MSRILPILFNTDMVRAILREYNPKTVTRRCIKGFIPDDAIWGYTAFIPEEYISCRGTFADGYGEKFFRLPYKPGDVLYVRETWCRGSLDYKKEQYYYKADNVNFPCEWHPSINMPKEAARIWLKVTDVRVERLQDITIADVIKEGCADLWIDAARPMKLIDIAGNKNEFTDIWNSTIKKSDLSSYGWDANPWVWVIEFERCEKPDIL